MKSWETDHTFNIQEPVSRKDWGFRDVEDEDDEIEIVGESETASERKQIKSRTEHRCGGEDSEDDSAGIEVHFTNPGWNAWLQEKAGLVCTALSGRKVKPEYRLKKLVLEGANSQIQSNEAIATLVVLLPSLFQDGDMLFDHGIQSKTVRLAPDSQLLTSIVAAYSVVTSKSCPITSGYRLALPYEVRQPAGDHLSIPAFPDMEDAALALRQAMVGWREDTAHTLKLLACFLQRKYPWEGFNLHALTGPDALLVTHLVHLARELDYRLYIAQVTVSEIYWGDYEGPTDKIDPNQMDHMELVDSWPADTRVNGFDMNSVPVYIRGFNFENGGHDGYLNGEIRDVESEDVYDMEDPDYMKIRVDATYSRTLFLLWPASDDEDDPVEIRYSHKYACRAVSSCISNPPSLREKLLVKSLSECCQTEDQKKDATRGPCTVAQLRNDVQMFLQILEENRVVANLDLIGIDLCVSAYRTFGWNLLKNFYHDAVNKDVSNPCRQALLVQLSQVASQCSDSDVEVWCKEQQMLMLNSLSRSSVSEVDWLHELATIHGVDFMRSILYPQLKAQQLESKFWVHFTRRLQHYPTARNLGSEFLRECVVQAAENLFAFPGREFAGDSWGYDNAEPQPGGLITEVFRLCVETGSIDSCAGIFKRMKGAADSGALSSGCSPRECYATLARSLDEYLPPLPEPTTLAFCPFFRDAEACMLSASCPVKVGQKRFEAFAFSDEHMATIVIAIKRAGGLSSMKDYDQKVLLARRDSENLKTIIRYLIAQLRPVPTHISAISDFAIVINSIVHQAIDVFDTKTFQGLDPTGKTSRSINEIVTMFEFCSEVDARSEWKHLLEHLTSTPPGIKTAQYVSTVLTPLMSALRDYLELQDLDLGTDPFKSFSAKVLKAFASSVMSQKPRELVANAKIGCGHRCEDCDNLRAFLSSDSLSIAFARPTAVREHLVKILRVEIPKSWGVTFEVRKYVLHITKPDNVTAGLEAENGERGRALLAVLGDAAAQRRILGSDYKEVLGQVSRRGRGAKRVLADDHGDRRTKKARSS
ncbi:hypothetical protein C8R44DRAFT_734924 [Mycena epipterygia]|nr:hypothetical protein C8R44DRAFT_734924 [Mycena epipterygia]